MPTLTRDSLRAGFTVAPRLAITPANENRCESRAVQRDGNERFVGWRPTVTEQVTVTRGAADTVLTRYELYAFNPRGRQTGEAQCVLRRGTAAATFMRGFFERPGRSGMVGVLAAQTATPVPDGDPPVFIGAGSTCLLDVSTWQMQCGSTTCYPQFALRVPTRTQRLGLVSDTATRAGGPASPLIGGWECPGMGNLSLNGDGTLTFHPDGGGGGGGGGGSCGGGNGGGGGDSSGDGSVNPPGSGGGATMWASAACDTIPFDSAGVTEMTNVIATCSAIPIEADGWSGTGAPPSESVSGEPLVCTTSECLSQNPGVWIGSWPIPSTLGFARHAAVATVAGGGGTPSVTELVGWVESITNEVHGPSSVPHYDGFGAYRWVRVADVGKVSDMRESSFHASFVYTGRLYALSSNRFVSAALNRAGITLSSTMRDRIGKTPGICTCGSC